MAINEKILYSNNAYSTLAAGINDVVTALTVQAGHGVRFSNPGAGECFIITLRDAAGTKMERCKCTTRSTDTFSNLTRGIDGTTAQNWAAGDKVEIRLGKLELEQFVQQDGRNLFAAAGGSADALTAVFTPAFSSLINGTQVRVRAASANTTATPTFAPDGLTAKTIVDPQGNALVAGSIKGAGHELILRYNSTSDKWVLLNPYLPFTAYILTLLDSVSSAAARAILSAVGLGDNNDFTGENTHAGIETFNKEIVFGASAEVGTGCSIQRNGNDLLVHLFGAARLLIKSALTGAAGDRWTISESAGIGGHDGAGNLVAGGLKGPGEVNFIKVWDNGNRVYSDSSMYEYVGGITANSYNANAHGLGAVPKLTQFRLRCITGELGYTAGDEVEFSSKTAGQAAPVYSSGWCDATNIGVVLATEILIRHKTTFADAVITNGNWNFVMRAWK